MADGKEVQRMAGSVAPWPEFEANRRGYQIVVEPTNPSSFGSAVDAAEVVRVGPPLESGPNVEGEALSYHRVDDEINDKVAEAKQAVKQIVESGVLGDGDVTASISGFANPGNEIPDGHPCDHITISIGRHVPTGIEES